ncbi:MAG: DNA polymerase IV, partial [Desulfuromonadales bacterium]|nr:DNA polymerase IV [Desulfuromonadales bacterium]
VCDVLRGSEAVFLAPLPVAVLPGVGAARQELMAELNLRRVGEVAALSAVQLRLPFGPFAPLLLQRARGIDPSPVRLPRQSLGLIEEMILPRAENDDALLLAELSRLVETFGFALRRQGRAAHTLLLTIGYEDGVSTERSHSFPAGEDRDRQLLAAAESLFLRACERRVRVKRLRLACTRLIPARRQLDLFATADAESERQDRLQEALDLLREKHGMRIVKRQF